MKRKYISYKICTIETYLHTYHEKFDLGWSFKEMEDFVIKTHGLDRACITSVNISNITLYTISKNGND